MNDHDQITSPPASGRDQNCVPLVALVVTLYGFVGCLVCACSASRRIVRSCVLCEDVSRVMTRRVQSPSTDFCFSSLCSSVQICLPQELRTQGKHNGRGTPKRAASTIVWSSLGCGLPLVLYGTTVWSGPCDRSVTVL